MALGAKVSRLSCTDYRGAAGIFWLKIQQLKQNGASALGLKAMQNETSRTDTRLDEFSSLSLKQAINQSRQEFF